METLLTYLFKASILLSIFYLIYYFLLKRDTFFIVNRHFFILGILISLFLPFLEFTTITYIENANLLVTETIPLVPARDNAALINNVSENSASKTNPFNWWQIGFMAYGIGILVFLIRFGVQLLSLRRLIYLKENPSNEPFNLIEVEKDIAPFSFFNTIVYNPSLHSSQELDMILTHEKVHAKQYHTIDLLISNIIVVFLWFNPFAWLYKKSLEQNLEFIADQEAINQISSTKEYQLALVNVSSSNYTAITNNFYQSLIKKRIIMLNKKPSKRKNLLKFAIILPLLSLFLWSFNTKEVIKYEEDIKTTQFEVRTVSQDSTKPYLSSLSKDISKKSTNEELTEFKEFIKKEFNVDFEFSNIKRKTNLITHITMTYKDDFGNQETYSQTNDNMGEPIEPIIFSIKVDKDGKTEKIGFMKPKSTAYSPIIIDNGENGRFLSSLGKNPIYFINGKQYTKSELIGKTFLTSNGIHLYLNENAVAKYGNIAKGGVVIIENATPWKSMSTRIDDEYRKKNKQAYLIAITGESHEFAYVNFEKMR